MSQTAKLSGGADDDLQIPFSRRRLAAIENPLADAVEQNDVRQFGAGAVEPAMNARDRRRLQVPKVAEARLLLDDLRRQQIEQAIERDRRDVPVGGKPVGLS